MAIRPIGPALKELRREAVLVQAWKKTSSYIRSHNWFSDTFELDRVAINLPDFLSSISNELSTGQFVASQPLRIVPAPKPQRWQIDESGRWGPSEKALGSRIRPLAHVTLRDQVLASAIMLCLADRAENAQGNPAASSNIVSSYGNRLYCEVSKGELRHRWGSAKLYRSYFDDYQSFLARPEARAATAALSARRVVILHSDISQFFDRVSPTLLAERLRQLQQPTDDPAFFDLATGFLRWSWAKQDRAEVNGYAKEAGLSSFSQVALPQGLVAAGFFSNIVLLQFDSFLRSSVGTEVIAGIRLEDACRYVDDLRLVFSIDDQRPIDDLRSQLFDWLASCLGDTTPGLALSQQKTFISAFRSDERPLLQQSRRMARIQSAMSGGFDVAAGVEILDAINGLVRTQQRLSSSDQEAQPRYPFAPVPDVRDATVDRFAAGKFRTTFRSLRLLVGDEAEADATDAATPTARRSGHRRRSDLDEEARAYSLELIGKWVVDPSNVRLLRVGLDLWPSAETLKQVLALLRPWTMSGAARKAPRRIAFYCLAEILRAGAIETGIVEDDEALPTQLDLSAYRELLREEARRLISQTGVQIPWYLKQQALLLMATAPSDDLRLPRARKNAEMGHYYSLLRFLLGQHDDMFVPEYATCAVAARRSFLDRDRAIELVGPSLTSARLNGIAVLDPDFALEVAGSNSALCRDLTPRVQLDLGFVGDGADSASSLHKLVTSPETRELLRNELSLLTFASHFLQAHAAEDPSGPLTPSEVELDFDPPKNRLAVVRGVRFKRMKATGSSLYDPPAWARHTEAWRFQLGYLLRFILTKRLDFTKAVRGPHWKERLPTYRPPESHWYQRVYGLFNGYSAFGDDWLPITEFTEDLLFRLLRWPGCPGSDEPSTRAMSAAKLQSRIANRINALTAIQGSSVSLMPMSLPRAFAREGDHPLRACIVQTIVPGESADFDPVDLTMSATSIRARHRQHLAAALEAVKRTLELRETHKKQDGRLDLLVLPELAVHPKDVRPVLVPFARAHRTTIVAGLTYDEIEAGQPLVNSAIWIMPTQDASRGLSVLIRRQGKQHLSPAELPFNASGLVIRPFRPCQWLIGYQWSKRENVEPLWLTAAVCYDATDIRLAADLKSHSDVFIVPALNQDVTTFDQMSLALHYHMFQLVIVANNGLYGGSNAYAPYAQAWDRRVFHMHGQPQASIAFLEIDNINEFKERRKPPIVTPKASPKKAGSTFKYPPAGS